MAPRTRKTTPKNLTLVDDNILADNHESSPATTPKKKATKPRKRAVTKTPPKSSKDSTPTANDAQDARVAPTTPKGPTKKGAAKPGSKKRATMMTMAELRDQYLVHLEREEKSPGTIFSYGIDLAVACV